MRPGIASVVVVALSASLPAQAQWTRLWPSSSPPAGSHGVMVGDDARGRVVLFGGVDQNQPLDAQWSFDGAAWAPYVGARPSPRLSHAMVYDSGRSRVLLFGGRGAGGLLADTWEWDGAAWTQRTPSIAPGARVGAALGYDPLRGHSVLFGGYDVFLPLGDTWIWNGSIWLPQSTTGSPPARGEPAFAYDPNRRGLVLLGGNSQGTWLDEMWIFTSGWGQLFPAMMPWPRSGHSLVTDAARRRVVLFGGTSPNNLQDPNVWEWDGTSWHQRVLAGPAPRSGHGIAYDSARRQVVLFSGYGMPADTWVYRTPWPADVTTVGSGCGGGAVPLAIDTQGRLPWLGEPFPSLVSPMPPGTPTFVLTGVAPGTTTPLAPFGFPGCDLHVDALALELRFADPTGAVSWPLDLPLAPALAGVVLGRQAAALDSTRTGGLAVTPALRLVLGIR